jgi:hypothetical protein
VSPFENQLPEQQHKDFQCPRQLEFPGAENAKSQCHESGDTSNLCQWNTIQAGNKVLRAVKVQYGKGHQRSIHEGVLLFPHGLNQSPLPGAAIPGWCDPFLFPGPLPDSFARPQLLH